MKKQEHRQRKPSQREKDGEKPPKMKYEGFLASFLKGKNPVSDGRKPTQLMGDGEGKPDFILNLPQKALSDGTSFYGKLQDCGEGANFLLPCRKNGSTMQHNQSNHSILQEVKATK